MIYGVQILRGLAALFVVLFHARYLVGSPEIEQLFRNGAVGVDIFFVISGVVMYLTAPALSAGDFMKKRLTRIVPLYWLFSLLKLFLLLAFSASERKIPLDAGYILKTFLFIPAYDGDGEVFPLIRAGWTLSFEMYFYIICAAALLLSRSRFLTFSLVTVALGSAVGTAILLATPGKPPAALYLLSPLALEFAGGMIAAHFWKRGWLPPLWTVPIILSASLVWLVMSPMMNQFELARPLIWGLPSVAIVFAFLACEAKVPFHRWTPLLILGDASYALYLCHTATIPIVHRFAAHIVTQPVALFLLIVLISVLGGIATHYLIERPLLDLVKGKGFRSPLRRTTR